MVMMAVQHYRPYRWVLAPIAALSLWLMASPFSLGLRSRSQIVSDVVSGVAALALAFVARGARRGLVCWCISLVGVWLLFAPLAFWSPDPAGFANDTLVGALLIAFALVIPMGMTMKGAAVPPGWTCNPSAWTGS